MKAKKPRQGKPQLKIVGVASMKVMLKGRKLKADTLTDDDLQYFKDLHQIVDDVFEAASEIYGMTWSQLASAAGLSPATVTNLGNRQTLYPRFMTVYKLCHAVGWELVTRTRGGKVRKVV